LLRVGFTCLAKVPNVRVDRRRDLILLTAAYITVAKDESTRSQRTMIAGEIVAAIKNVI
jgi:hypothetical protein